MPDEYGDALHAYGHDAEPAKGWTPYTQPYTGHGEDRAARARASSYAARLEHGRQPTPAPIIRRAGGGGGSSSDAAHFDPDAFANLAELRQRFDARGRPPVGQAQGGGGGLGDDDDDAGGPLRPTSPAKQQAVALDRIHDRFRPGGREGGRCWPAAPVLMPQPVPIPVVAAGARDEKGSHSKSGNSNSRDPEKRGLLLPRIGDLGLELEPVAFAKDKDARKGRHTLSRADVKKSGRVRPCRTGRFDAVGLMC